MRNIILSVDEEVLSAVPKHAAEHSTTVNQLVREYLGEIAQRENRARTAPLPPYAEQQIDRKDRTR